jgi:hypothetical protein
MRQLLDDHAYHEMLCFLDNQHVIEKPAEKENLIFLKNDWWLANTAVIASVNYNNGGWEVFLTIANYKKPLQLIIRKIIRCYSESKARTAAHYMRRIAAKDQRGTLVVTVQDLNLCLN